MKDRASDTWPGTKTEAQPLGNGPQTAGTDDTPSGTYLDTSILGLGISKDIITFLGW